MYADGVFFDEFGYYRFFEVEYLDTKGFLPMAINVDFDAQVYATTVKGARINVSLVKAVKLACKAFGMDFNNTDDIIAIIRDTASEDVIEYVSGEVMPAYIDEEGRQVFYDRVMTHIYACLVDKYGTKTPVSCPYETEQRFYAEGQGTLIDWDNSKLSETMASLNWEGTISPLSGDNLFDFIEEIKDKDEHHRAIFQCPIVRFFYRTGYAPGVTQIYINGYTIENNNIVTTTDSASAQHYGALITSIKGVYYFSENNQTPTEQDHWSIDNYNMSDTFYNSPQWGYYNRNGLKYGSIIGNGTVIDSLGYVGQIKPYEVIGTTPSSRPISENYPTYPKSGDDYPVGEEDPDEPTDQDYIWRGVPEPNPPIPPVIGAPPQRRPDVDGDETLPDVSTIEGLYGLFTVYKPTTLDLKELGAFLWQDDTITALLNIFKNDPMQAIISLHQLYFDPSAPNSRSLKLGTVPVKRINHSDMVIPFINDRYQRLACGFVKINRYFNDIRDYQTKISIYLPFIGIRELDINEMLDATVFTDYYVDTYTGDCVATISITRDNSTTKKVLAMYNGNCASPLPLTGADKSRLFANVASIGAGLVSTIATKGATAGGLINSVMNTATSHNITIEKSGSMGGNWGAMGYKKPYFIIERPQTYDAVQKEKIIGFGANLTTSLAQMRGFVRVSAVHVDNIPGATDIEKARIEQLLKEGIFL